MKRNVPIFGLLIGLVTPVLGYIIVYFIFRAGGQPIGEFTRSLVNNHQVASKVLSLGLLLNIVPFIFYTNKRLDYTARGILVATILYAVFIILIKYVW